MRKYEANAHASDIINDAMWQVPCVLAYEYHMQVVMHVGSSMMRYDRRPASSHEVADGSISDTIGDAKWQPSCVLADKTLSDRQHMSIRGVA